MTPAYILHRRSYSNTSLLLDIFTLDYGRLSVISRGTRSLRGNCLQPFVPLHLAWRGRGDIKTLTQYESIGQTKLQQGNPLYCGLYINELLSRLLNKHEQVRTLFAYYSWTLDNISNNVEAIENILRYFEIQLLAEMGYPLRLDIDIKGNAISNEGYYQYRIEYGFERTSSENFLVSGNTLLALSRNEITSDNQRKESKQLLRQILRHYLGEKPLLSRQLFTPIKI